MNDRPTDPRVAPVEDNLEDFMRAVSSEPVFTRSDDQDVIAVWSSYPFPLMNSLTCARFAPGTVEQRAREVVQPFLDRGLPFLWWTTPSGHAAELGPVLTDLGMQGEAVPGMYLEVTRPVDPRIGEGVEVRLVEGAEIPESIDVMLEGFEMPDFIHEAFHGMRALVDSEQMIQVTAWLDGRAVGCGSGWVSGSTVGLYNITTLPRARRRGIGYAVTATLVNAAFERGATAVVLHASDDGLPVYERLGFESVCEVPQYVWLPPAQD
jgi:GNAT superfamily N-acetyltransferase